MHPPIYFARHGQTAWNADNRLQGSRDVSLNSEGKRQAVRNGKALAAHQLDWSAFRFICSPLERTRDTMTLMLQAMNAEPGYSGVNVTEFEIDERLIEFSFGRWEGMSLSEVENKYSVEWSAREANKWGYQPPGGESYAMLAARLDPFLSELTTPAVLVAHGGVQRVFRHLWGGVPHEKAVKLPVPQDQVCRLVDHIESWI
ncbi:MAG: histidine phosphatase family protein [Hyphomicrobiales bacterium]|nr:MAG: histidine phosphatase family protein [Hyphomicrobiales bacterium]